MYKAEWLGSIKPAPPPTVHQRDKFMQYAERVWAQRDFCIDEKSEAGCILLGGHDFGPPNQTLIDEFANLARILEGIALGTITVRLAQ